MTTTSKTSLSFAGEYFIEECYMETRDGVSIDFMAQVSSIVVYEDLFSPFISGALFLRDTLDLPNLFGRGGMNVLKLKIHTPSFPERTSINGFFHVYKMADRELSKQREQTYTLRFISLEAVSDQKKLSRSFSGSPEVIAETLVKKYLDSKKPLISNPTSNQIKYVSNLWTPTRNMTYLSENARRKEGVANYLFFENRDGFNFRNISDIAEENPIQKFSYNDYLTVAKNDAAPQYVTRDKNEDYKKILDLKIDVTYDYEKDRDVGAIKTSLYVADPVLKRYKTIRYSMGSDKSQRLNKNLPYSDVVIGLTDNFSESLNRYYNAFDRGDPSNLNYLQARVAQLRRYQSLKIEIQVLGRMDYTVGRKVQVEIPYVRNIGPNDEPIDKLYSGMYIISAISHSFGSDRHTCTIELIKDSTLLT